MEKKAKSTTEEDVRASISSIYADLISKKQAAREAREEERRQQKLEEKEKRIKEDGTKMTKRERRQAEFDNWKEVIFGLTGDDLEYSSPKKNKKKKYRKWIGEDDIGTITTVKQKKPKKKNYNKEFEPELNMLRNLVTEQNKFTADLQRRFQNAAGPATKDAMVPNKAMVDLAAAIMTGRSNSLGMLREIGSIKKNIATLYMNQKKLDSQLGGNVSTDDGDLALMGSNLAASLFGDSSSFNTPSPVPNNPVVSNEYQPTVVRGTVVPGSLQLPTEKVVPFDNSSNFDPASWVGPTLENSFTESETIPHTVIVEKDRNNGNMRFVAIRNDDGSELSGCNVPTVDPNTLTVNEKDMTVKGQFDEVYTLRYTS